MIDEKKLIEDLLHNDGIEIHMDFKCSTKEETRHSLQQFIDKFKEGIVNLINAQPKILFGVDLAQREEGWISAKEQQPKFFESVLMYVPCDSPLPVVHEGYLTGDEFWMSLYGDRTRWKKYRFGCRCLNPRRMVAADEERGLQARSNGVSASGQIHGL